LFIFKEEKILFLDGHNSHISIEVIDLAITDKITLICLIPHSTHALQAFDVSVFKPLKTAWKAIVSEYYLTNNFDTISKPVFPSLLKKIYEKALQPQHATGGFVKTGLFPLNRDKIDASRCATAESFDDSSSTTKNPSLPLSPSPSTSSTIPHTAPITISNSSVIVSTIQASSSIVSNNSTPSINLLSSKYQMVPLNSSTPTRKF
jgi:hypothetical protein